MDRAGWGFLAGAVIFLGTELYTLLNRAEGDTFSERVWSWLRGRQPDLPAERVFQAGEPVVRSSDPRGFMLDLARGGPLRLVTWRRTVRAYGAAKVVRKGIKVNTWRWFVAACTMVWLTGHFLLGWWAG